MVAPLIATGARVVGSKVIKRTPKSKIQNAKKVSAATKHSRLLHKVRTRERQGVSGNIHNQTTAVKKGFRKVSFSNKMLDVIPPDKKTAQRTKAIVAATSIAWFVILLYTIQFVFGIISLAGLGIQVTAENFLWEIFSGFVPGLSIFAAGYVVALVFSLCSLFVAIGIFTFRGVNYLQGNGLAVLIICFVGSFIPLIANLLPWAIIWMLYVISSQK